MLGSLYTSVAGLKGHLTALNVTGNNISNMNSIGFKGGRVTFRETLVQTLRGASQPQDGLGGISPLQMGLGMGVSTIDSVLSQGVLQNTGVATDLGINGQGFFILSDGTKEYYTRVGSFGYDANGNLISPANGFIVQGRMADDDGTISTGTAISSITLPFGRKVAARATDNVTFGCNLDASATSSTASLSTAGATGITSVQGSAANGSGGTHAITITGVNATASTLAGTNLTSPAALTGSETLGTLGVTVFDDFSLSVDGAPGTLISGLSATSTVNDLINAINASATGVTASLAGGEVVLARNYAGDGTIYNVTSSLGADGNISRQILGAGSGAAFAVASGTASTLAATDVFTPTGRAALDPVNLTLATDPATGLVTGISNLGGSGVTITAANGLAEGSAVINTAATEHYTSVVVYDSLGVEHNLSVRFTKSPTANQWYWNASLGGAETIKGGSSGTVSFASDGSLASFAYDGGATGLVFDPTSGGSDVVVGFDPGRIGGFDGVTQFASPFSTSAKSQNGYGMGALTDISIDSVGVITGSFSNGVTKPIAQIMLAKFNNPGGLERVGDGLYRTSSNSGQAIKGEAGKIVQATVAGGSLEMSNVDLAEEFVNMIVAQRGFQANARVLTASDEMLTDLVNITR